MQVSDLATTYLCETQELLERIEQITLELETRPDKELVNELFRAFHTIKGSGAMCGFHDIAQFTHHVETTLDDVRAGAIPVSKQLVELVLQARDQIHSLVSQASGQDSQRADSRSTVIAALAALSGTQKAQPEAVSAPQIEERIEEARLRDWKIRFHPDPRILAFGTNVAGLFRELARMGTCTVSANIYDVPELESMEPENCYLWWEIDLETERDRDAIREVFEFVEDGGHLTIEPATSGHDRAPKADRPATKPVRVQLKAQPLVSSILPREDAARRSCDDVPSQKLHRLANLAGELVKDQLGLGGPAFTSRSPTTQMEIEHLVSE